MMSRISTILGALFVVAFAVFLVTSNVRWALNSLQLYEFGFRRHDVALRTDLTLKQLSEAGRQIRDYFNSSQEPLDMRITVDGATRALYNDREIQHMRDVKELAWGAYRVQEGTLLYLVLFATLGFFVLGNEFAGRLRSLLVRGSFLTVVLIVMVGLGSVVSFGPLFVLFHQISFSNDLWQLDPYTSYLVRMFPQGFWLEATLLIGLASIVEAAAVVMLLTLIGWWRQWRQSVAQRKMPQLV